MTKAPLFILTCMRSYSSLVSSMLGQHPGLYTLPEMNPFVEEQIGPYVELATMVRPRTLDGLYRAIAEIEFGDQSEDAIENARNWVSERASWSLTDMLDHVAKAVAPLRVIDKSPSTVLSDENLSRAFRAYPDAYYLHLYRNPVATTRSIAAITGYEGQSSEETPGPRASLGRRDPEMSWYAANLRIIQAGATLPPGNFMSARGEDVLRNPEEFLPQICNWLGLSATAEDVEAMLHPERSPYAFVGPEAAPFGNDPNFLKDPAYERREVQELSLETPLDWDSPERHLLPETIAISQQLGYG